MATETGIEVTADPPIAGSRYRPPEPLPADAGIPMPPDGLGYRLKRKLLGPPLHSDELDHQRLGKPTALAVFASDNLSSSAYATEEILHALVPVVGLLAFSLVMPITGALLVMLALLILSYRQTIKAYPSAGGAYLVTRDNFGIVPAQVAGAALLVGYILTVSVSVSAGTAALISSFDALSPYRVPISLGFIAIVMYGNLRGVKESGKVFAVPTYFFMLNMGVLLAYGMYKYAGGDLATITEYAEGTIHLPSKRVSANDGLFYGATAYLLAKAFASGGAAVTGVEAISNGIPAFREPAWKNARQTLVVMGAGLGVMFLGLSLLASKVKVLPFEEGTPTVLAQIGEAVYGTGAVGRGAQLLAPGGHDADPRAGGQHRLRRLPPAGQLPGRRQLPAPPAHEARPPPRVLQRHHRPRRHRGAPRGHHQRRRHPPHPALRHRRLRGVHPVAGRHDEAPPAPQGAGLAHRAARQRHRRRPLRRRRARRAASRGSTTRGSC